MKLTWKNTWTILFFIVLLGTVLRFSSLGENSFTADEFLDMNGSYGYLKTGEWKAWDFNFDRPAEMNQNVARDERALAYKWQVAKLFSFLPPTEATARSVSALWGIFTIFLIFWAGWFYTRKKTVGLLAAFLFAVSISALIFDRRLRMYAMFTPVYLAFATVLFAVLEREYWDKWALSFTNSSSGSALTSSASFDGQYCSGTGCLSFSLCLSCLEKRGGIQKQVCHSFHSGARFSRSNSRVCSRCRETVYQGNNLFRQPLFVFWISFFGF